MIKLAKKADRYPDVGWDWETGITIVAIGLVCLIEDDRERRQRKRDLVLKSKKKKLLRKKRKLVRKKR